MIEKASIRISSGLPANGFQSLTAFKWPSNYFSCVIISKFKVKFFLLLSFNWKMIDTAKVGLILICIFYSTFEFGRLWKCGGKNLTVVCSNSQFTACDMFAHFFCCLKQKSEIPNSGVYRTKKSRTFESSSRFVDFDFHFFNPTKSRLKFDFFSTFFDFHFFWSTFFCIDFYRL